MCTNQDKARAPRNRTLVLCDDERRRLRASLATAPLEKVPSSGGIVLGDSLACASSLPKEYFDLLFLDPPYNLNKDFNGLSFTKMAIGDYAQWLSRILEAFKPSLKKTATIYICGDWNSSPAIFMAASEHFVVRNRITWEREKGRGALRNWKNSSEDIWFCTMSNEYYFDVEAVKVRRRVIAPYTNADGSPKDWNQTEQGGFRDTHPSNLWTDITIPFWSMPENTDHPTQKSEKLIAKLLLASSEVGARVLDPFLGSGTTCVVAKKLGRHALGIEINEEYALWAARRLELAEMERGIQGYTGGVFWERNTLAAQGQNGSTRDGNRTQADAPSERPVTRQLNLLGSSST